MHVTADRAWTTPARSRLQEQVIAADQRSNYEQQEARVSAQDDVQETAANGAASDPQAHVAELEERLAQARAEAATNWDKYLRERAEMENFRKRQERMAGDAIRSEKKKLLHKVLEVMDNLDRAMHFEESMDRESLHQGLRMVQWQLNELLKEEGLTPVPTVGQPFDPRIHDAIEQVQTGEHPEGTVVEEVRKGYMLGDEMLRPARVKVSSGAES
jgi:molecular chaperone GrpE